MSATKQIVLVPHDSNWKNIFETEQAALKKALGNNFISIHHVGSTAIPELMSKPRIDIIAEVHNPEATIEQLKDLGYEYKGEFNIPLHWGFAKRGSIDFNLHVYHKNNPEVKLNLMFRDWLKEHPEDRQTYGTIKEQLLTDPKNHQKDNPFFARYTLEKGIFIKKILNKADFKENRIAFCADAQEWQEYHRIKKEQIFDPANIILDLQHPSLTSPDHFHFILYHGTTIVAIAHLKYFQNNAAILRALATDTPFQKQGFASLLLQKIEQWLKTKQKTILYANARKNILDFYTRRGFLLGNFDDPSNNENSIKIKKIL